MNDNYFVTIKCGKCNKMLSTDSEKPLKCANCVIVNHTCAGQITTADIKRCRNCQLLLTFDHFLANYLKIREG